LFSCSVILCVRGAAKSQPELVCLISPESVVPKNHPIRQVKKDIDQVLRDMGGLFDEMYAEQGRPSIPPERLLKAKVLIALYSVRSENLFVEQLHYNLLFRWFLDMDLSEEVFDNSTFSKNQERFFKHGTVDLFFDKVVELARERHWISEEHFTVDGTLIEAWASLKSFAPKDQTERKDDGDPGNPTVDFKGQKRSNATHQSTTDPESRLYKKGPGKEAKLCFGAHALMENRHGLCVNLTVRCATGETEPSVAQEQMAEHRERHATNPLSVGADKAYHTREFVENCRQQGIAPHVAQVEGRKTSGLDGRTTRSKGYKTSQRVRKKVEEIFGWMKTIGGFRKTRFRGIKRTNMSAKMVGAAYNLLRMAKLGMSPPAVAALS